MSNTPQTPEKQADHSIDTATGQEAPAEISSARVKKIFTDIAWKYERFNKQPKHIILSDYTPAMLEVAQSRLDAGEANGVPVELAVVDGQDIPYEDESFDVITMSYGIRNMPERERALSEMYRVLKPGGALCVLEFSTPPNPLMRLGYNLYLRWGIPAWGKIVTGDASGFVYLAKSIKAFPDQKGFTRMLKDAGFSRVEYTNVTFGVAAVHIAYKE